MKKSGKVQSENFCREFGPFRIFKNVLEYHNREKLGGHKGLFCSFFQEKDSLYPEIEVKVRIKRQLLNERTLLQCVVWSRSKNQSGTDTA